MKLIEKKHDIIIVGGGTAGVMAAIAAGRQGADVLLVERYGCLGGMSTGGMINFYNSFHNLKGEQVIGGISWEIVEKLVEMNATPGAERDYSGLTGSLVIYNQKLLELLLFRMVEESGAKLLLHSFLSDVIYKDGHIEAVEVINKSGKMRLYGKVFIDATGDADIAVEAGAHYEESDSGHTQPVTLEIRVGGVDTQKVRQYIVEHPDQFELDCDPEDVWKQKYLVQWCVGIPALQQWDEEGKLKYGLTHNQIWFNTHEPEASRGIFTLNATRVANVSGVNVEDLTRAEVDSRKEIPILLDFFRSNVPGFENAYLVDMASQMGVRETRRVLGDYTITREDVMEGRKQPDVITKVVSQIDIHGSDKFDDKKFSWTKLPKNADRNYDFDVPYRAIIPMDLDNLLIAGRPISTDRGAHGAIRFMPPCMAIGEAAGVAAALSVRHDVSLREVDIAELQDNLRKQGAIL